MITVKEQLEIVKGLMGYRYGDPDIDARVTDAIAAQMATWGISDIRNFGRVEDSLQIDCTEYGGHTGVLSGFHYVNNRTGASITPVSWTGFTGTGAYEGMGYGGSGGFWCGQYTNPDSEFTYEWDSRFNNYIGDAGIQGENRIQIFVNFTQDGIPYFTAKLFNTRGMSFWQAVRELATIAIAAVTFVVPGVNAAVAGSIFGSFATAYPALTAAASQVMLQTALSGGDVEAAVKSVAYSYLGQSAGGIVAGVSDSESIGQMAAAATTAAARGGDVQQAVAMTALRLAPSAISDVVDYLQSDTEISIDAPPESALDLALSVESAPSVITGDTAVSIFDIPTSAPSQDWDSLYTSANAAPDLDEIASWAPATVDFGTVFDNGSVPTVAPIFEPMGYSLDDLFASATGSVPETAPAAATGLSDAIVNTPADTPVDVPASSFFEDMTWDDTVDKLTSLAVAALRVNQAYQAANRPPTQPAVSATRAGTTQTARSDGTLATVDPATGRAVVTRPPAGVPYELPNGAGAVVNNGNGTYTVVSPTGQTTTRSYASDVPLSGVARVQAETWVAGVPNWAILAAGVGAFALIARR